MKQKTIFLVSLFFASFLMAQETPVSSANESTGSNGSVSYSVGLLVVKTLESSDGSVSQGAQIPLEVTQLLSINDPFFNDVAIHVFPNPTANVLQLKTGKHSDLSYQLFDLNGKLIKNQKKMISEKIALDNVKSGTYLLKILQATKEIKTFKIIKK
ncbi:T9SS type A sorting domain-containing protein [Kordia sp.]|uniref:T9SS type A sorting domain-containing protein n=1 Tax=Kordia sp. TaxID=1965332 RepID=UPI003B59E32F